MKRIGLIVVIATLTIVTSSCAHFSDTAENTDLDTTTKYNIIYDKTLSESNSCNLELANTVAITLFDGEPVFWASQGSGLDVKIGRVPIGAHDVVVFCAMVQRDAKTGLSMGTTRFYEEFSCDFLAGHTYRVFVSMSFFNFNIKFKDITK